MLVQWCWLDTRPPIMRSPPPRRKSNPCIPPAALLEIEAPNLPRHSFSHPACPLPAIRCLPFRHRLAGTSPLLAALLAALLGLAVLYYLAFNLYFITLPGAQGGPRSRHPITTALLLAGGSPLPTLPTPRHRQLYGVVYMGPSCRSPRSSAPPCRPPLRQPFSSCSPARVNLRILRSANTGPLCSRRRRLLLPPQRHHYALAARPRRLGRTALSRHRQPRTRTPGQSPPSLAVSPPAPPSSCWPSTQTLFCPRPRSRPVAVACQSGIRRAIVSPPSPALFCSSLCCSPSFLALFTFHNFTVNRFNENDSFAQLLSQFFDFYVASCRSPPRSLAPLFLCSCAAPPRLRHHPLPKISPAGASILVLNLLLAALAVISFLGRHRRLLPRLLGSLITPLLLSSPSAPLPRSGALALSRPRLVPSTPSFS